MRTYKSFLADEIRKYITYRTGLGFSVRNTGRYLEIFDQYVVKHAFCIEDLKQIFFVNFRQSLLSKYEARTVNNIFSGVNGLVKYLIRKDYALEPPLANLSIIPERKFIPYIFSIEDTNRLLSAIQKDIRKEEEYFFKDFTKYIVIALLARCGMRISEPLKLLRSAYNKSDGTIYIEKTKFHKDRLIPVPQATIPDLENYLAIRDSTIKKDYNPYMFPGNGQKKIHPNHIYEVFHKGVNAIGIHSPQKIIGDCKFGSPICHSFRHSFAINTLKQIKQTGKSPQDALPFLAAYMGHKKYQSTAVYLKAVDASHRKRLYDFSPKYLNEV